MVWFPRFSALYPARFVVCFGFGCALLCVCLCVCVCVCSLCDLRALSVCVFVGFLRLFGTVVFGVEWCLLCEEEGREVSARERGKRVQQGVLARHLTLKLN